MKSLTLLAVCLAGIGTSAFGLDWHVDPAAKAGGDGSSEHPFASLPAAIAALPGAPEEPLVLRLAADVHRIESTLEITPRHSRGKPLLIDGGGRAVISGGKRLDPWRIHDGKWTHLLAKGESTRELFVNGERRAMARFPTTGWLRVAAALPDKRSGFTAQADLPAAGPGTELLFLHDWSISRIPVASIKGRLLKTTGPIGFPAAHYAIDHYEPHPRFCLENDPSFLIEKGTWCHENRDQNRIIYLPRDSESPENTVIEIPVARQLLKITGTAERMLRDVRFEGITFEHYRWDVPPSGYAEGQATKHVPRDAPATEGNSHGQWKFVDWAIIVEHARHVVFQHCRFRNLGGGGVFLGPATRSCALENCHVTDVSGNGMFLDEGSTGFLIDNNLIHGVDRSPLRFHKAGKLNVTHNAWLLPADTPPLRFNATDPALIDASENSIVDAAALAALVRTWKENHPPPTPH